MNGSMRFLPLTLAAVLAVTAFSGCGKKSVGDCVKQGTTAADAGDWDSALKFASKGVDNSPESIDALLLKAVAAKRCRKHDVAYEAASKAVKLAPDSFSAQYTLGCVCMDVPARKAEAKQAFLAAHKLNQKDRDTLIAICNLKAESGDKDLLTYITRLEKCSSAAEKSSEVFRNQKGVALLLASPNNLKRAQSEFDAAQMSDAGWNDPNIVYNVACAYDEKRLYGERRDLVRERYERYMELTEKDKSAEPARKLVRQRIGELGGR